MKDENFSHDRNLRLPRLLSGNARPLIARPPVPAKTTVHAGLRLQRQVRLARECNRFNSYGRRRENLSKADFLYETSPNIRVV
jgi:hypothetical protein